MPARATLAVVSLTLAGVFASFVLAAPPGRQSDGDEPQWGWYGADAGGSRHSPAAQITRDNVEDLQVAWTYRSGELGTGFARAAKLAFEATPILVRGLLYLSTPTSIVIALDPATGTERWRHDPKIPRDLHYSEATSRGVSSWVDRNADPATECAHRILIGTLDARLIALDGPTGRPCRDFGNGGSVDLALDARPTGRGDYLVTSPPAISASACPPPLPVPAALAIFAADHGVHAQGVSPWPQEVTLQMVGNFLAGGAVANAFAAQVDASVTVVDVGVAADLAPAPGLTISKVAYGTADLSLGPAMTAGQAVAALEVGIAATTSRGRPWENIWSC